jgi:hypothetical protein
MNIFKLFIKGAFSNIATLAISVLSVIFIYPKYFLTLQENQLATFLLFVELSYILQNIDFGISGFVIPKISHYLNSKDDNIAFSYGFNMYRKINHIANSIFLISTAMAGLFFLIHLVKLDTLISALIFIFSVKFSLKSFIYQAILRCEGRYALMTISGAVSNLIFVTVSLILIPQFGIIGASFPYLVRSLIYYSSLKKYTKLNFNQYFDIKNYYYIRFSGNFYAFITNISHTSYMSIDIPIQSFFGNPEEIQVFASTKRFFDFSKSISDATIVASYPAFSRYKVGTSLPFLGILFVLNIFIFSFCFLVNSFFVQKIGIEAFFSESINAFLLPSYMLLSLDFIYKTKLMSEGNFQRSGTIAGIQLLFKIVVYVILARIDFNLKDAAPVFIACLVFPYLFFFNRKSKR